MKLENLTPGTSIDGVIPNSIVEVIGVRWFGSNALELTYKDPTGNLSNTLLYRDDEPRLKIVEAGRPWSFDGDGTLFRLVSEAQRIHLAHLFDPHLAVHTSLVEPFPHQITAVYETMLPRQPLRFLLADDPGSGKTIMAGLLMKELIARGDLKRCLVVCPGNLAEQWQDELYQRFQLPFDILTNDKLEASHSGNWFLDTDLVIARLDKLARDETTRDKLKVPDATWDLIIVDEAHKMSATFFGGEVKYTKRYRLGQLLGGITRHFLLMTATPHNGKDTDFQLFMALLDADRFEGRFRDGVHQVDTSDLMRRMVKENLLRFDGRPLFPERRANTVPYKLSNKEAVLYQKVTEYVREEFNKAEALQNDRQAGTVGFALTVLQRRLASSPAAILRSLTRRKERLESRLNEVELLRRGQKVEFLDSFIGLEDIEDIDDAPDNELKQFEAELLGKATAARTIEELRSEISILKDLENYARQIYHSGEDAKWKELAELLQAIFGPESLRPKEFADISGRSQKLVVFTEHRDTLAYLEERVSSALGDSARVVTIHGGMTRQQRLHAQEAFRHDPSVNVLIATDAAGEGINLQRAHLMVNYDLPWNPNRLEQRFGRIHRIGQTEVCHLWNLVAEETREGDVYKRLLEKLDAAREQLGGQVFDVLGKLQFEGKPLRQLLIEAIRYGDQEEVRARLEHAIADAVDTPHLQTLLEDNALAPEVMDATKIAKVRTEMERAAARRLQPHFIEEFFLESFRSLGGTIRGREARRYEITHVPAEIRNRDRQIGTREPVLRKYERITFEKDLIQLPSKPLAAFVAPGHPLLDATLDIILERHRELLKRGTVLVDEHDDGTMPRVLSYLEHSVKDGVVLQNGRNRVISKRMLYIETDCQGNTRHLQYAPYLDYRPLTEDEPDITEILEHENTSWITSGIEQQILDYAVECVVPGHLNEIRNPRVESVQKIRAAVNQRLQKEISYWDHRAQHLMALESAGRQPGRLNSSEANRRADELQMRLKNRLQELDLEEQVAPNPPIVTGGSIIVPIGLIRLLSGVSQGKSKPIVDTQVIAAKARDIIMNVERELGFIPIDREFERLGYDIESKDPQTGKLRFIEVKGRTSSADTITVTKNEVLFALTNAETYILAIVEFLDGNKYNVHYVQDPFGREPDFGVTSSNYSMKHLLAKAGAPA